MSKYDLDKIIEDAEKNIDGEVDKLDKEELAKLSELEKAHWDSVDAGRNRDVDKALSWAKYYAGKDEREITYDNPYREKIASPEHQAKKAAIIAQFDKDMGPVDIEDASEDLSQEELDALYPPVKSAGVKDCSADYKQKLSEPAEIDDADDDKLGYFDDPKFDSIDWEEAEKTVKSMEANSKELNGPPGAVMYQSYVLNDFEFKSALGPVPDGECPKCHFMLGIKMEGSNHQYGCPALVEETMEKDADDEADEFCPDCKRRTYTDYEEPETHVFCKSCAPMGVKCAEPNCYQCSKGTFTPHIAINIDSCGFCSEEWDNCRCPIDPVC